ncbi:hypothetical protein HU200_055653 [Digitaria exilis]|uniref:Uncharacterized protein n=1 Tax=Digitaria exilis TaxID=1010633 RepID=A0A835AIF1_9POAL|nr:hypothetical protein HU200_055653 [Digitaria exilis]
MEGGDEAPGKKARKPYTITKPREKWSADEHGRFLDALLMFGRDWKKIEEHVLTKTTVQVTTTTNRSLKSLTSPPLTRSLNLKGGLVAGLPPAYPRRGLAMAQQSSAAAAPFLHGEPQCEPVAVPPGPSDSDAVARGGIGWNSPGVLLPEAKMQRGLDWAGDSGSGTRASWLSYRVKLVRTVSGGSRFSGALNFSSSSMEWAGSSSSGGSPIGPVENELVKLPLSPDDPHFAQVYRFVGDIFDPKTPIPLEAHLQKLKDMDDITVKTILLVLKNLENNLAAPQFEPIRRLLSTYDPRRGLSGQL